ncbi:hypothetical protein AAOGI_06630 [Agarivorans albus]
MRLALLTGVLLMVAAIGYTSLPRGVRNNNPLNIRKGNDWQGETVSFDGAFESFINPIYGFRAAAMIIKGAYRNRGITTLSEVVTVWAPESDNNPTTHYIDFVAERTGLNANSTVTDEVLALVLHAMSVFELGGDYFGLAMAQQGVNLA